MKFEFFPRVVKANAKSNIFIKGENKENLLTDNEYTIEITPVEKREIPRNRDFIINKNEFTTLKIKPIENTITFNHFFASEQMWCITLSLDDEIIKREFIYSLNDDLFERRPFKGDLHIHSTRSDGKQEPFEIGSHYRECGYDFIALTDHHKYAPSLELLETYKEVNTGLTIFPGEEVHNNGMGYFHIVNFDGKYSVNKVLEDNYENIKAQLKEKSKNIIVPKDIDPLEFCFRKWICDEIRKSGGKAIFPHPCWTYRNEYHTEMQMSKYVIENNLYDIFEVIGGCSEDENNVQVAFYNEMRSLGNIIPIVGSSDCHDVLESPHFDNIKTIVFAESASSITKSIMDLYSVAVENLPYGIEKGPVTRIYGSLRLVKYSLFLIDNFFNKYEEILKPIGLLMQEYAKGDKTKIAEIEKINNKAQKYKNMFFI